MPLVVWKLYVYWTPLGRLDQAVRGAALHALTGILALKKRMATPSKTRPIEFSLGYPAPEFLRLRPQILRGGNRWIPK